VAFRAEVAPVVLEVYLCLCACSVSVDSVLRHFVKECSSPFDFHETLLGAFLSQTRPCSAQETQHPVSSLLGLRPEVS